MDAASLAAAMVGAQTARRQMAAAALMMRMNADNEAAGVQLAATAMMMRMNAVNAASVVQIIDSARQNMASLANVSAGVGQNVNISGRIQVPKETPEPFPACSALAALSSRASKTSSGVA